MAHRAAAADFNFRHLSSQASESSVFHRMIVSSIIQDKKLRIPSKFVKKFGIQLPAVATLTTPNGCVWQVGLKKIDDKVWFTHGWHEFVEHQSIRVGHLVVFTYEGNSNFRVNIYDIASAEIKYQCNTLSSSGAFNFVNRCPVAYKEEVEDNDLAEFLNSCPPYNFTGTEFKNSKYTANGGNFHGNITRSAARSTRDVGVQCNDGDFKASGYQIKLHSLNQRSEMSKKRKRGMGPYELESPAKHGGESQTPGVGTSGGTLLRKWRVVTPEEKERVLNASKMFQSENPFCRVILRRSYVYKGIGLHMPSSFAEKYLGGISGFITLQGSRGEKWPVRCMWRDGSAKLSKGWPEFVLDNRLEEGDACVFELINLEEVVLKVTIFRAVQDAGTANQLPKELLGRTSQLANNYDLNG